MRLRDACRWIFIDERAALAGQLIACQRELLGEMQKAQRLAERLETWQGIAVATRKQWDADRRAKVEAQDALRTAEARLAQAHADAEELLGRAQWLERELADTQRSNGELKDRLGRTRKGKAA